MELTIAQRVDSDIQKVLNGNAGVSVIECLLDLGVDWSFDLSIEEYKEFVKRNVKEFAKRIETELEDRL